MLCATVTSKGQITIPKEVRDQLHIKPGHQISFVLRGNREVVMRAKNRSALDLIGVLHKPGRKAVTVDEMNEALRTRFKGFK